MSREIKAPKVEVMVSASFDGKHTIEFNESSHRYKLNGKAAVGVTTFTKGGWPTSMGLISWGKGVTAEALFQALTVPGEGGLVPREGFWPLTDDAKKEIIKTAKTADRAVAQEAADIGTICHGFAELHSLGKVKEAEALLDQVRKVDAWPLIESCVRKYLEWAMKSRGELVMAEALCGYVCPRHQDATVPTDDDCTCFCGKFDRLDMVNGKLRLRDYKTSKDIFAEQFIQLGGYRPAIQTWYNRDVLEFEVLRFGKDDGSFDSMIIDDPKEIERFQRAAFRCRQNHNDIKFFNSDPRWAWKGNKANDASR